MSKSGSGDGELLSSRANRVIAIGFVMDLCAAMTMLAVQNLGVLILRAPPAILGLFGTVRAAVKSVTAPFTGRLSDRYGRRPGAMLGCVLPAVAWFLLPGVDNWPAVLGLMAIFGLGLALFWPSIQAWLAELAGEEQRRLSETLGLFNIAWAAGMMLGPVVTGYLWPIEYSLTFYVPVALAVLLAAQVMFMPEGSSQSAAADTEKDAARRHPDNPTFMLVSRMGNFAAYFAGGIIMVMFPKLGYDELHFTESTVGWLLFCVKAGQLIVFVLTRHYSGWQYRLWPIVAAETGACGALLLATFATTGPAFAASFGIVGLSAGLTYVSSLFYGLHGYDEDRGKHSGIHEAVISGGRVFGPLLGGLAAQYINLRSPYLVAASAFAAVAGLQIYLYQRRGRSGHGDSDYRA